MNNRYSQFFILTIISLAILLSSTAVIAQSRKVSGVIKLETSSTATIKADKYVYNNGETVVITGNGYRQFEPVTLNIESNNNLVGKNESLQQWTVYTDYNGKFSTEINMNSLSSPSGTYTIKAVSAKSTTETTIVAAPQAVGVNIDQCANGAIATPNPCNFSSGNEGYSRGNLTRSKSHYVEGDSVPIRIVADGLTVGQQYTITIGYDFTKGGKYAVDYLTTFNRTEVNNNNPCVDTGLTCTLGANGTAIPTDTEAVPTDPQVEAGFDGVPATGDDINQIDGVFSLFGGHFCDAPCDPVSDYTLDGNTTGDSSKLLTITFVADSTTVVLAYGAHIAERIDWGFGNSAISISGSPYHNFIRAFPASNSGSRDLQFSASAIVYKALITIIKDANPNLPQTFNFAVSGAGSAGVTPTSFTLDDFSGSPTPDRQLINNVATFGAANQIVVTEAETFGWRFNQQLSSCTETSGGGGFPTSNDSRFSTNNGQGVLTITAQEGEIIQCTFVNELVLAAGASVTGSITDSFGNGISNTRVRLTNVSTGEIRTILTSPFGYYQFDELEVGENYLITVSNKRYEFSPNSRFITLNEDAAGVDFIGTVR